MRQTLTQLIEIAFDIKVYFRLDSYELYHYEEGSFVDFHVQNVLDLPTLLRLADKLELKFFAGDGYMIVRLFESYNDL